MNAIRSLTKEDIIKLANECDSIRDVFKKIGIKSYNSTYYYKVFKMRCRELEIDAFPRSDQKEKRERVSDQQVVDACKNNICRQHALNTLGLNEAGSNIRWIKTREKKLNIDTSHWKKNFTESAIKRNTIPIKDVLIANSTYANTGHLKNKLLKAKLVEYKCNHCGINKWNNKPLSLHLEHKNGVNNDHRIENLELLCPNCHSQTPTYCRGAGRTKIMASSSIGRCA